MAKVKLPENIVNSGRDICCGCIHCSEKNGSEEGSCNFSVKYRGAAHKKVSANECDMFEPTLYAGTHWEISGIDYIGISEHRLHHILGVARKAYRLAKEMGKDEDFARKCFMLGWLHDIGYEFSYIPEQHAARSAEMYLLLHDSCTVSDKNERSYKAIRHHGSSQAEFTDEFKILNMADLLVDSDGKEVDVKTRLKGIKNRYGATSSQYINAVTIGVAVGLISTEDCYTYFDDRRSTLAANTPAELINMLKEALIDACK